MSSAYTPVAFGRYVLLEKIAVGGMAEIFKAHYRADRDFEKVVVIKRILPHLATNDDFITMFRDEAKVNVRLTHANIVQVFDFGREANDYYLAMEYVQGQNLRRVLKRAAEVGTPALPIPFALYVAQETAKGLAYAHTRKDNANRDLNIIHRDVTPSNILVSYEGEVKITDFGIAKAASKTGSTQQGMVKGKAPYLAPEQLQPARSVDARVDVFALGAVTWELLTGKRLIQGETDMEILGHLMSGAPFPKPSEVKGAITPEVDRVVMKALEREPDDRYPSAAAFQKELAVLVSRFAMTSAEASAFMTRLFSAEIDAEASASLALPVVDPAHVTEGAALEATRTRRSEHPPAPDSAEELEGRADAATRFVTPSSPRSSPTPPAPVAQTAAVAPAARRSRVYALATAAALVAAGIGLGVTRPWEAAARKRPETTIPVAGWSPTATPAPSPTPEETGTPVAVSTRGAETPAPARTPRPGGTRVAARTPAPPPVTRPAAVEPPGLLSIDSQPWGRIYVDGVDSGRETPAFDLEVPPGPHVIRIVNSDQHLEHSLQITIESRARHRLGTVKLAPRR